MNRLLRATPIYLIGALVAAAASGCGNTGGTFQMPEQSSVAAPFVDWVYYYIFWLCVFYFIHIMGMMGWFMWKYRRRPGHETQPSPHHNLPLEIAWTVVPIVILIFIGAFSLPVLFDQQEIPEGDVHIKVTGFQWYWGYEYPDEEVAFESFMIGAGMGNLNEEILAELNEAGYGADEFKLATDTAVVVPVGATVVMDVTAADVIHSWTIPAFGVKQDAVPGRIAQLWFEAEQEGVYFGQCSELCGKDHAYMPITVRAVSPEEFETWAQETQERYAGVERPVTVAAAE